MTINRNKTDRRVLTMPKELSAKVEAYRVSHGIKCGSTALRLLVVAGLDAKTIGTVR
jgi:hypothetical protein